jgi:hypothetical protein
LVYELEVDDDGLRGIVALAKMSTTFGWCFSKVLEYGDGVHVCGVVELKDVSSGESICIWRFARGELGRPLGDSGR